MRYAVFYDLVVAVFGEQSSSYQSYIDRIMYAKDHLQRFLPANQQLPALHEPIPLPEELKFLVHDFGGIDFEKSYSEYPVLNGYVPNKTVYFNPPVLQVPPPPPPVSIFP